MRLPRLVKRLTAANLHLGAAAGRLALSYLEEVVASLRDLREDGPMAQATQERPLPKVPPAQLPLVLEASAGKPAVGAFLLHNRLTVRVEAPLVVGAFKADDGREVIPEIAFEPAVITLDPGQQMLVRLRVQANKLAPDTDYRGIVTVPGLANGRLELVVRRRGRHTSRRSTAQTAS